MELQNGKPAKVFVAMPYCGTVVSPEVFLAGSHYASADKFSNVFFPSNGPGGSHCENFNKLWCMALNSREREGWTHFAMIHSDVEPENYWLDILLAEMGRVDADLISVLLPIKDKRGVTSTALIDRESLYVHRITMKEMVELPETFDAAGAGEPGSDLMISSGLWVCKFTPHPIVGEWQPHVWFEMRDRIARLPDGRFTQFNFSEDWGFSRQCHEWGLRLFSTQKVRAWHHGGNGYSNDSSKWQAPSAWEHDEDASCGQWLDEMEGMKSRVGHAVDPSLLLQENE